MYESYQRQLHLPVSAETAFLWHEQPGALDRLIPPWERVNVINRCQGIYDGCLVHLAQKLGPFSLKWISKHHNYVKGHCFSDTQISGPFSKWDHLHRFQHNDDGDAILTDQIYYQLPGSSLGNWLAGGFVKRKVDAMFAYRHNTTKNDLAAHARYQHQGTIDVAVTGSTGLLCSTLVPLLTTGGHRVTRLVRKQQHPAEIVWDPQADAFDATPLDGIDAVVHLAGENIAAARWSKKIKNKILDSRVQGTRILCESLAKMANPPKVLVCASAIGFYGNAGNTLLTEQSPSGEGFLAEVAQQWEAACQPARDAGIRVVNLRFGMILSPRGGALAKMLTPFKLGAGGRIGSGKQYWSWISIDDAAGAIHHALMTESLSGPVNAVAPEPTTNAQFTKSLGTVLHRPTLFPMPPIAARLALGEMADELLLTSIRVAPAKLLQSGYTFRQPTLEAALRHLLGKTE